jgi:hypothetical protein
MSIERRTMVVQSIVWLKKLEAVHVVGGDEPTRSFLRLDTQEKLSAQAQGLGSGGGRGILGARLGAGSKFRKVFLSGGEEQELLVEREREKV